MNTLFAIYLYFLCVSGGFWFFGHELSVVGITSRSMDLDALAADYDALSQGYEGGTGFNTAFIFGDFPKAITEFMNIVTGKYVFVMLTLFGFAQSFVTVMQVIVGFLVIGTLVYLVSGRLIEGNGG